MEREERRRDKQDQDQDQTNKQIDGGRRNTHGRYEKGKRERKIGRGERERKSILTPTRYKEVKKGGEKSEGKLSCTQKKRYTCIYHKKREKEE